MAQASLSESNHQGKYPPLSHKDHGLHHERKGNPAESNSIPHSYRTMGYLKYWYDLADLAAGRMEILVEKGLLALRSGTALPAKESKENNPRALLRQAEARAARLDKNQVVWVQPGGAIREDFGYQSIRVFDAPSRTDMAIIAAVTIAHADQIQPPSRVQKAVPLIERMYEALSFSEYSPLKTLESMPEELHLSEPVPFKTMEEALESLKPLLEEPQFKGTSMDDLQPEVVQTLAYAKDLLRHYRADLDELPLEEQVDLMQHTCQRINAVLEAVRKLVEFAEHGSPSGDSKPAVKQAIRDVKAAELYEVARPTYPKLAEMLGEPPPSKRDLDQNDHPKVRNMVERGRDIMVRAFGEDGLQELIEAMKEQRKHWESLDEAERWLERLSILFSERYGLPPDRARKVTEYYVQVRAGSSNTTIPEVCRTIAAE